MRFEFGTITCTPSRDITRVARRPMSSTVAEHAARIDEVALLDRSLDQHEQTRDEVLGELLQTKADADEQDRAAAP